MDREQELQFLGFFGIFKESFKIISSWRKIFGQITLALVIPLSALSLAHIVISDLLFSNVTNDIGNRLVGNTQGSTDVNSSKVATFLLFEAAYFISLLILSLLATAAVVYTIACIYTAKEITFKKVMSAVPRVWKRLAVTFLWSFAVAFVYNVVAGVILFLWARFLGGTGVGLILIVILAVAYLIGIVYITIVWDLASVVSVLEEVYGIKSMMKSRALIKGKMGVAVAFLILLSICIAGIEFVFEAFVVNDEFLSLGIRIVVGILCCLLLFMLVLFGLVVQTVIYFVCKSYHHESIDRPSLTAHLEAYLGNYVHLNPAKDVQLSEPPV
ncbi:hypothetical protein CJ030_MR6G010853 [Morella rubra]|uniref:Uncharacterized protein n=1 Tax=Morella rubra TaxID=262757 RepID=A0A6A1VFF0_9ROSI|nr:hypothetical protein CJ030_MR6G010853 [Morella rubra]